MKRLIASLVAVFSVPLLVVACGGDGGDPAQQFEEACKKACSALVSADCSKYNITQSQCDSQCPFLEDQLDGFCVQEYADVLDCAGNLNYSCKDGYPYPDDPAACTSEALAFNKCQQSLGCKKFCKAATEAGCGGAGEAGCVQDCEAARPTDSFCDYDYDNLRECQANNMVCKNGKPSSEQCQEERSDLVSCFSSFGQGTSCDGFCFIAVDEGCSANSAVCKTDCEAAVTQDVSSSSSCSYDFEYLQECEVNSMVCEAGKPVIKADCKSEASQAANCLSYEDDCLASCWLTEYNGCATSDLNTCRTSCKAELDNAGSCDYYFQDLLSCRVSNNIVCELEVSVACDYAEQSYADCKANNP